MVIRSLINNDGSPFESTEIQTMRLTLDDLENGKRVDYRKQNALAIAEHDAIKFLIVSGPGTGKSHIFKQKIDYWFIKDQCARVIVLSFVRKLVLDLQGDIKTDETITEEQKEKIEFTTLHKLARSIVEKNKETTEWSFSPYFKMIGQSWKEVVWNDVLAFYPDIEHSVYLWKEFEHLLHNDNYYQSIEWKKLKEKYFELCKFYNAAGFADLILRATKVLKENSYLVEYNYFIVDEYQDFNLAEEALIKELLNNLKGLLVAGDDEQVLYEGLKSGKSTFIRELYKNKDYVNGMLPFCGRSSYHIIKASDYFIQQHREEGSIEKIYLPINKNIHEPKVQVIACATPSTAVDYIERFILHYKVEIDKRKNQLESGEKKDAYLLILTPANEVKYYGREPKVKLKKIVSEYQLETRYLSGDYYKLLNYYSLADKNNFRDNFTFRKVLHHENVSDYKVHELIDKSMQHNQDFFDLEFPEIDTVVSNCKNTKKILDSNFTTIEKVEQISKIISINDKVKLQEDIEQNPINNEDEEDAELEEIEIKRMCAVELMSIVGSKGLSADHVIIIGFDDVNMNKITKNAFYVAITRARKSLHLITALKSGGSKKAHKYLDKLPDAHLQFYKYTKRDRAKVELGSRNSFANYLKKLQGHTISKK